MAKSEDPFHIVKGELDKSIRKIEDKLSQLRRSQPGDHNYSSLVNEIKTLTQAAEWDVQDLSDTLTAISQNPVKYKLSDDELESRRALIETSSRRVRDAKSNLESITKGGSGSSSYVRFDNGSNANSNEPSVSYNNGGRLQQQFQAVRQQDEQLDALSGHVSSLKQVSVAINDELNDQDKLLDDFSTDMQHSESRLDTNMRKLAKLLRMTDDKRQWTVIGILIAILLVIVILFIII